MAMGPAVRLVRQVQIALLVSIALYAQQGKGLRGRWPTIQRILCFTPFPLFRSASWRDRGGAPDAGLAVRSAAARKLRRQCCADALENRLSLLVRAVRVVGRVWAHPAYVRLHACKRLGFLSGWISATPAVLSASAPLRTQLIWIGGRVKLDNHLRLFGCHSGSLPSE